MANRTVPIHRGGIGGFPPSAYCLFDPSGTPNPTIHGPTEQGCWRAAERRLLQPQAVLQKAGYTVELADFPEVAQP